MQSDSWQFTHRDRPFHVLEYHTRYRNEELIKYMPYRPGLRVLDYGCAKGVMLEQLDGRTGGAWGADRMAPRADACLAPDQVSIACHDRLPFPEGTFDVVFGEEPLRWSSDPTPALREFARILRPDGWLVLWVKRRRAKAEDLGHRLQRAGFVTRFREPFDYAAYPVVCALARIPLLNRAYLSQTITKGMFALDGLLARMPALYDKSWHLIVAAERGYSSR